MTQFGSVAPPSQFSVRANLAPAPRVGITETLDAPGIVAGSLESHGYHQFAELERSLGLALNAGANIAAQYRQDSKEAQRLKEHEDVHMRGLGAQQGREALPKFAEQVSNGQIPVENPEAAVDAYIKASTDQSNPAQAEGFASLRDDFLRVMYAKRAENNQLAKGESVALLANAMASGGDASSTIQAGDMAGLNTEERDQAVIDAMKIVASEKGDRSRVNELRQSLSRPYPSADIQIETSLRESENRSRIQGERDFRNQLGALELQGAPIERRRDFIQSQTGVSEGVRANEMKILNTEERVKAAEAAQQLDKVTLAQEIQSTTDADVSLVRAGLGTSIQSKTITLPSGKTHTISGTDRLESAMNIQREQIMNQEINDAKAQNRPINQNTIITKTANLSALNGYVPPDWKATIDAGAASASIAQLASTENKDHQPPAVVTAGFNLYQTLKDTNPNFLASMGIHEDAKKFYELAGTVRNLPGTTTDSDAIKRAATIRENPQAFDTSTQNLIDSAVSKTVGPWFWTTKVENWPSVAAEVKQLARDVYLPAGLTVDAAVKKAVQTVNDGRVVSNGWSIKLTDPRLSQQTRTSFDQISRKFAEDYVSRYGQSEGVTTDDLFLKDVNGAYALYRKDGLLANGPAEATFFDYTQLEQAARDLMAKEAQDIRTRTIQRQGVQPGFVRPTHIEP